MSAESAKKATKSVKKANKAVKKATKATKKVRRSGPGSSRKARSARSRIPIKAKLASSLYHLPGMFNYTRTRPDRCYASEAAAKRDGLTPAKR